MLAAIDGQRCAVHDSDREGACVKLLQFGEGAGVLDLPRDAAWPSLAGALSTLLPALGVAAPAAAASLEPRVLSLALYRAPQPVLLALQDSGVLLCWNCAAPTPQLLEEVSLVGDAKETRLGDATIRVVHAGDYGAAAAAAGAQLVCEGQGGAAPYPISVRAISVSKDEVNVRVDDEEAEHPPFEFEVSAAGLRVRCPDPGSELAGAAELQVWGNWIYERLNSVALSADSTDDEFRRRVLAQESPLDVAMQLLDYAHDAFADGSQSVLGCGAAMASTQNVRTKMEAVLRALGQELVDMQRQPYKPAASALYGASAGEIQRNLCAAFFEHRFAVLRDVVFVFAYKLRFRNDRSVQGEQPEPPAQACEKIMQELRAEAMLRSYRVLAFLSSEALGDDFLDADDSYDEDGRYAHRADRCCRSLLGSYCDSRQNCLGELQALHSGTVHCQELYQPGGSGLVHHLLEMQRPDVALKMLSLLKLESSTQDQMRVYPAELELAIGRSFAQLDQFDKARQMLSSVANAFAIKASFSDSQAEWLGRFKEITRCLDARPSIALEFAQQAVQLSPRDLQQDVEAELRSNAFRFALECGDHRYAYNMAVSNHGRRRKADVGTFVRKLHDLSQLDPFLSAEFWSVAEFSSSREPTSVPRILLDTGRWSPNGNSAKPYFDAAFSFYSRRGQWREAAEVMYELAARFLQLDGASSEGAEQCAAARDCLALSVSSLRMLPASESAWIERSAPGGDQGGRKRGREESSPAEQLQGALPPPLHRCQLEQECALLSARLELFESSRQYPLTLVKAALTASSAEDAAKRLLVMPSGSASAADMEAAATLCYLYGLDVSPVLEALAKAYVYAKRSSEKQLAQLVSNQAERLLRKYGEPGAAAPEFAAARHALSRQQLALVYAETVLKFDLDSNVPMPAWADCAACYDDKRNLTAIAPMVALLMRYSSGELPAGGRFCASPLQRAAHLALDAFGEDGSGISRTVPATQGEISTRPADRLDATFDNSALRQPIRDAPCVPWALMLALLERLEGLEAMSAASDAAELSERLRWVLSTSRQFPKQAEDGSGRMSLG